MFGLIKRTLKSSSAKPTELVEGDFNLYLPSENITIGYHLTLSTRRKSISLEILKNKICVKAPYWTNLQFIESFLLKKQRWIVQKQHQQLSTPNNQIDYQSGSKLMFLGQYITLTIELGAKYNCYLENEVLTLTIPKKLKNPTAYIRKKIIEFYHQQAQLHISPRFVELQNEMQLQAKELQFKLYKRRWGCCYSSGLIRVNPMIMGSPKWVIDCVLIHELSHLKHMNHSNKFWQLNKQYCEYCDESKKWLFKHSQVLTLPYTN